MATTKKGIYYPNDGTKVADILTDMEKMAESIDGVIEENEFDPSQLNQSIINLQQNVTNLKESQTAQDNEINQIKGTLTNKETEIAKSIHIEDAEGFGKLSILGNHEQNGEPSEKNPVEIKCLGNNKKNLFSLDNKLENAQIDYFDKIIENSSDYDTYYIELEEGQSFVLSLKFSNDYYKTAISSWGYLSEIPTIGASFDWDKIGRSNLGEINNTTFEARKKYFVISILKEILTYIYDIQLEKGTVATPFVPYRQGSTEIKVENSDKTQDLTYVLPIQQEMLKGDVFSKELDGWKEVHNWQKIDSYNGENITTDYISTTGSLTTGATVFYKLQTPIKIPCTEEQSKILNQLNALDLFESVNDITTTENIALLQLKYVSNVNEVDILKEEIEDLKDNQIHIETEQSSTINVQDCSNLSAKIDVFGVSEQETRSGKNKFDIDSFKDISFVLNGSGEVTDNYINVIATEQNVTYTNNALQNVDSILPEQYRKYCSELVEGENVFSFKFENKSTNKLASVYYNLLDENYKAINQIYRLADDTNVSGKLSVTINNSNAKYLYPRFDACVGGNVVYSEIMVAQDLTEYEKYGASPSPEYPSEIQNVGDNVNEFDISKITNTTRITNDGKTLTIANNPNSMGAADTGKTLKQLCQNLKVGDIVTLSFKTTAQNTEYKNSIFIGRYWSNGKTITLTETDLNTNIVIYGGYQETSVISEIKIEKGECATSYIPYGCGNMNITVCNKNLLPYPYKTITELDIVTDLGDGRLLLNGTLASNVAKEIQEFYLKAGSYKLLFNTEKVPNTSYFLIQNMKTQEYIKQGMSINTNFELQEDTNIKILFVLVAGTYNNYEMNLMVINTNSYNEDYVSHQAQTEIFPLAQGQKLMLGDYLADDGIHHKRKQIELDGTENWKIVGNTYYITITDKKIRYELTKGKMLCTHFKETQGIGTADIQLNEFFEGYYVTGNYNVFFNYDNGVGGIDNWKSYLAQQKTAETPVILEYELETEEIEQYTEEQQTQRDQLQNAKTYKTVTNVFTDKAELVFKYIADTKTYIDNKYNSLAQQILEIAGGN